VREPNKAKPTRRAVAFWTIDHLGQVLLRQRPDKGLLGGMMEVPSTAWREGDMPDAAETAAAAPAQTAWTPLCGHVRHSFTHFHFEISVLAARLNGSKQAHAAARVTGGEWFRLDDLGSLALPTVMRKIVAHAMKGGTN
jgi:A/G-specific adenine glycosylase